MWRPASGGGNGLPFVCQAVMSGAVPRDAKVVPLSRILASL